MGSDKTVLLVCRSISEICLLKGFQPQPDCRYIVGSDDLRVHLEIGKYSWVAEVCYLEKMESLFAVAADVIKYLELINQWLASLGNNPEGVPEELLFWLRVCEGGVTTQRIQDLLLLIRSYEYLIDTFNISSVIILSHPQKEWEDDVLTKVGQSKGAEVRIIGHLSLSILKGKLLSMMKLLAREPYYILSILRDKFWRGVRFHKPQISGKEIVIQMCIPHDKFVEHTILSMKALKNQGYDPVALLWRASKAAVKFKQEGLWVEKLETFVPMTCIYDAPWRVWLTWRQARLRRHEFLAHSGLQYRNIPLGPLLWPSVVSFFWEELPQRYRLRQAAKQYFTSHSPLAIRLWGGGTLAEGRIVSISLNDKQRPLVFLWLGALMEDPYYEVPPTDLFLVDGDYQVNYLNERGIPAQRIVTVGLSRYDYLPTFRKEYSPSQSKTYLNIPQVYQYYILFDPNYTLRGYLTLQEQSLVTEALLRFTREQSSLALMIKPHPAHSPGWLEELVKDFSLPNVYVIEKEMLPYHALNAADLVITKVSTLALDAMLFGKPVISILLDGEERFRVYGDAVERANSLEALNKILTMMISDTGKRADWVKNQRKNQEYFLKNYFGNIIFDSAKMGAEALDKFISNNQELSSKI